MNMIIFKLVCSFVINNIEFCKLKIHAKSFVISYIKILLCA